MAALRAPGDLGPDGRALWRRLAGWLEERQVDLDPHEVALVEEIVRTVDRLAALRGALVGLSPIDDVWRKCASEERQQRLALGRLISSLGLPTGLADAPAGDGLVSVGQTPRSRRAKKAATARWGADRWEGGTGAA